MSDTSTMGGLVENARDLCEERTRSTTGMREGTISTDGGIGYGQGKSDSMEGDGG